MVESNRADASAFHPALRTPSSGTSGAVKVCPICDSVYTDITLLRCPRDNAELRPRRGPDEPTEPDLSGRVVADRYDLVRLLGRGASAEVYLANDRKTRGQCAVKLLNPKLEATADMTRRFSEGAYRGAEIRHPNVVLITDFGESNLGLFIVMEYVDGRPLSAILEEDGPLLPDRVATIVEQVARALTAAHTHQLRIIHRDVKPANIIISRDPDGHDFVKVVDFGIAKALESTDQSLTQAGTFLGTPEYMSPEQAGTGPVDQRSDVYSLGLVAFRMLTGKLPFPPAENAIAAASIRISRRPLALREVRSDVAWSSGLEAVFRRVLAREPDQRYQTAMAFASELSMALRRRYAIPHPVWWTLAGLVGSATIAVILWWIIGHTGKNDRGEDPPISVAVSPDSVRLVVGDSQLLHLSDGRGNSLPEDSATWRSSSEAVAAVSKRGWVFGRSPGFTSVTVQRGPAHDTARVFIGAPPDSTGEFVLQGELPRGAGVALDGQQLQGTRIALPPGTHTVVVSRRGTPDVSYTFEIRVGHTVTWRPPDPPRPSRAELTALRARVDEDIRRAGLLADAGQYDRAGELLRGTMGATQAMRAEYPTATAVQELADRAKRALGEIRADCESEERARGTSLNCPR
jgi:serine/threonine protein kinase